MGYSFIQNAMNAIKVKKQTQVGKNWTSRLKSDNGGIDVTAKKQGYTNKLNIISIKNCLVDSFNSLNNPIKNRLKHSVYLAAMQSIPIQKKGEL